MTHSSPRRLVNILKELAEKRVEEVAAARELSVSLVFLARAKEILSSPANPAHFSSQATHSPSLPHWRDAMEALARQEEHLYFLYFNTLVFRSDLGSD